MIHGETVSVALREFGAVDEYGNDAEAYSEPFEVENVLVGRPDSRDRIEDGQPYAVESDIRFCFPKGFSADLRGALVTRKGAVYKVVGEPMEYTEENLPPLLPWNIRAEAVRRDG